MGTSFVPPSPSLVSKDDFVTFPSTDPFDMIRRPPPRPKASAASITANLAGYRDPTPSAPRGCRLLRSRAVDRRQLPLYSSCPPKDCLSHATLPRISFLSRRLFGGGPSEHRRTMKALRLHHRAAGSERAGLDQRHTYPTADWVVRQITEAFPWNEAPRHMIRNRDRIYGAAVTRRLRAMGIRDRPIAPASPWQNGFAERLIGSIRRECLDHVIVLGEAHLRRILLKSCARYYNGVRTHRSLNKDTPDSRPVQRSGLISSHAIFGALHHHYLWV
jgi:transposase InsO family protein